MLRFCKKPANSRLNVVVRSLTPFGLVRNGCWPSRGSQMPRALPSNHFFAVLPPERPQKSSTQLFKNRSLVFPLLLPLSCPSSSRSFTADERQRLSQPWFRLFLLYSSTVQSIKTLTPPARIPPLFNLSPLC